LAYAVPLVPHALAMTGLASFDQVVISQLLGLEQTGLYALAYRFGMAMFLIAFGVASAWNPLVYKELGKSERGIDLGSTAKSAFRVASLVAALLCFALPGLAVVVGGPAYASSARLIPIVVYGYLWMMLYSLAVPFLTFDNRTGTLAKSSAAAFVANAVLNYLLIPQYGVAAAALTTVVSYALLFLLVWRRLDRSLGVPFGRLLREALAFAPVCWLAWLVYSS
jgi:O-antigen/teichoic acid export membrane protein